MIFLLTLSHRPTVPRTIKDSSHSSSVVVPSKGVSLLEILIAFAVLGAIVTPILFTFLQTTSIIKIGKHDLEVMNIGTSFVTQMKNVDISKVSVVPSQPVVVEDGDFYNCFTSDPTIKIWLPKWDSTFTLKFEVTDLSPPPAMNGSTRKILCAVLKISWKEKMGEIKEQCFPVFFFKG